MLEFYPCLLVACLVLAQGGLTQGKVSDACHGSSDYNGTHNVMECQSGSQICITEVKFYTKQTFGCVSLNYYAPPPAGCCRHDPNECSKVVSSAALQSICSGRSQCRVLSPTSEFIFTPCPSGFSFQSKVRSITYWCSLTGSCSETASETTTPRGNLQKTAQPKESSGDRPTGPRSDSSSETTTTTSPSKDTTAPDVNDSSGSDSSVDYTGVIVGCAVAIIALVIGIAAAIFLSRWWRAKKRENAKRAARTSYLTPTNPAFPTTPAIALTNDPYNNLPIAPSAPPPNTGPYLSLHGEIHNTPNNNLPNAPSPIPPNRHSYLSLHNQSQNTPYNNLNQVDAYVEPQINTSFVDNVPVYEEPEYADAL